MYKGYKYNEDGKHNGYIILKDLPEVAKFIISDQKDKTITDMVDQLTLNTFGTFIHVCPDKKLLAELHPLLTEDLSVDKNICEYELIWHPCGDCAEYPDCKKDIKTCSYSEAYLPELSLKDKAKELVKILVDNNIDDEYVLAEAIWDIFISTSFPDDVELEENNVLNQVVLLDKVLSKQEQTKEQEIEYLGIHLRGLGNEGIWSRPDIILAYPKGLKLEVKIVIKNASDMYDGMYDEEGSAEDKADYILGALESAEIPCYCLYHELESVYL